jgi:DNA-binding CsgD family transcriptional regulator
MLNARGAGLLQAGVPTHQSSSSGLGALRANRVRIRTLIGALGPSPIGVAICDRRLRFVEVNPRLAEINTIPVDDHPGKSIHDLVGDLAPTIAARLTGVFNTARPLVNAELVGRLGANPKSGRWIENYFPIFDARNRVVQVGVFILPISRLDSGDCPNARPSEVALSSSVNWLSDGNQVHRLTLSPRDTDVLRLLADGKCPKEVASILGISLKTVEVYRSRLMLKLGTHSLADLVHYAIRHQLIQVH